MELRQIEYFLRTAEVGSVSGAALELHITQPALSRQIAELERNLGVALFVRHPRGVRLTDAGAAFRTHAADILARLERTPEVVRVALKQRRQLRIGIPPGLPHPWFRAFVLRVEGSGLPVDFSLCEGRSDAQRMLLRSGDIDLALLHAEPHEGFFRHVLTQPLGAAVPASSGLAGRDQLGLADLDGLIVMAHAVGEIKAQEVKLRRAAESAGVNTTWVFRQFSHHGALIAELAGADAVLSTRASASINLPGWAWVPLDSRMQAGHGLQVRTWAAWLDTAPSLVPAVVELMAGDFSPGRTPAATAPQPHRGGPPAPDPAGTADTRPA